MQKKYSSLWVLCHITLNIKDLTKFGSKIEEVDTSHLNFFFNLCKPFRTRYARSKEIFIEKTGGPLIFGPSVLDNTVLIIIKLKITDDNLIIQPKCAFLLSILDF